MAIKASGFRSALLAKGFLHDRNTTDQLFYLWVGGQKTKIWTKISHGRGEELGHGLIRQIKYQLNLTSAELNRFVECALTREAYAQLLIEKGVITLQRDGSDDSKERL